MASTGQPHVKLYPNNYCINTHNSKSVAARPTGIFPGVPAAQSTTDYQ